MAVTAPAPRVLADVFPRSVARDALLIIGGALFVGITAQIAFHLPFTPVLFTGQTFGVLLVGASLGAIRGMLSMLLYSVAGLVGVPWFAGFGTGFSASFGYILGFIAAAGLVGWLAERGWTRTALDTALAMVLGNVVIYALGVTWLKFAMNFTWGTAVFVGMSVFLIGDAIKIALAAGLFPLVWRQLSKHGLAPRTGEPAAQSTAIAESAESTAIAETEASPADSTDTETAAESDTDESVIDLTDPKTDAVVGETGTARESAD